MSSVTIPGIDTGPQGSAIGAYLSTIGNRSTETIHLTEPVSDIASKWPFRVP